MSRTGLPAAAGVTSLSAGMEAAEIAAPAVPPPPTAQCDAPSPRGSCFPKPPPCVPNNRSSTDDLNLIADGVALLRAERNCGGRPTVVDEHIKGKMVILLATGLSLRQTAAFLGITHPTVSAAIAADPELAADIADARVRAELHPLAHLIREGGRSWKTAVWLLEYLQKQNESARKEEEQIEKMAQKRAAPRHKHPPNPPPPPMPASELARIAAIRAQRPGRKRRPK